MAKFAVTIISPPGYLHSAVFQDVADTVHHGLIALGHDSVQTTHGAIPGRRHIVFGSNLLPQYPVPLASDAILYNLEQVEVDSPWFQTGMIDILRRHAVWDYSQGNAAALQALGVQVKSVVPIGYVTELTRFQPVAEPDIDVLFIGSIPPRRRVILDQMHASGLKVSAAFGLYGPERDALIARARLVLNIHQHEAKILELVGISYLLANRCAVLSEHSANPEEDAEFADGVAFADYADLPRRARELIDAPEERQRLSQRGFELMRARPAAQYLRTALAGSV